MCTALDSTHRASSFAGSASPDLPPDAPQPMARVEESYWIARVEERADCNAAETAMGINKARGSNATEPTKKRPLLLEGSKGPINMG